MLVLTRKKNQGVLIKGKDGDIRIVIIELDKGRVRLGIEAPQGHLIIREELLHEIEGANKLAAVTDLDRIKRMLNEGSGEDDRS
jgi:carbon storage regulator